MPSQDQPSSISRTNASPSTAQQPTQGCLLRIFWMALGNLLLLSSAAMIAKHKVWSFSVADIGYWAVVMLLLATRYMDIKRFNGETTNGEPATMAHLKRYAVGLMVVACGLWALVHSISI